MDMQLLLPIEFFKLTLVLLIVIPHTYDDRQSIDDGSLVAKRTVDEHLAELMPIFERLRQQEQIPCAFPMHMGAGGTAFFRNTTRLVSLSPHTAHCHPSTHWVSYVRVIVFGV